MIDFFSVCASMLVNARMLVVCLFACLDVCLIVGSFACFSFARFIGVVGSLCA